MRGAGLIFGIAIFWCGIGGARAPLTFFVPALAVVFDGRI